MHYYLVIAIEDGSYIIRFKVEQETASEYGVDGGWCEVTQSVYNQAEVDTMCYNPYTQELYPVPLHITKAATTTQINYPTEDSDLCLQDWMDDVDTALSGVSGGAVAGSYTGNGDASRTIALDFTPSAVLVLRNDSVLADTSNIIGGLATASSPVQTSAGASAIAIVENGFTVGRGTGYTTNVSTKVYNYIAFR